MRRGVAMGTVLDTVKSDPERTTIVAGYRIIVPYLAMARSVSSVPLQPEAVLPGRR
jgi:hypothetical protein